MRLPVVNESPFLPARVDGLPCLPAELGLRSAGSSRFRLGPAVASTQFTRSSEPGSALREITLSRLLGSRGLSDGRQRKAHKKLGGAARRAGTWEGDFPA